MERSSDWLFAKLLATKYHAGQTYDDLPYVEEHLAKVVASVEAGTTDIRLPIVAWLHDILEDTACTEEILRALFEDNIVDAVVAITKKPMETRDDYLFRCRANPLARVVKTHDSACNLLANVGRGDAKRIARYCDQIKFMVGG